MFSLAHPNSWLVFKKQARDKCLTLKFHMRSFPGRGGRGGRFPGAGRRRYQAPLAPRAGVRSAGRNSRGALLRGAKGCWTRFALRETGRTSFSVTLKLGAAASQPFTLSHSVWVPEARKARGESISSPTLPAARLDTTSAANCHTLQRKQGSPSTSLGLFLGNSLFTALACPTSLWG